MWLQWAPSLPPWNHPSPIAWTCPPFLPFQMNYNPVYHSSIGCRLRWHQSSWCERLGPWGPSLRWRRFHVFRRGRDRKSRPSLWKWNRNSWLNTFSGGRDRKSRPSLCKRKRYLNDKVNAFSILNYHIYFRHITLNSCLNTFSKRVSWWAGS